MNVRRTQVALGGIVLAFWACVPAAPTPSGEPIEVAPPNASVPAEAARAGASPPLSRVTRDAPEARIDPDGSVVVGDAGAMRRVPGPGETPKGLSTIALQSDLAKLRMKIRRCYERALQMDPAVQGKVTISVVFDSDGNVKRANIVSREGVPDETARCLVAAVSSVNIGAGANDRDMVIPFVLAPPP